MQQRQLIPFFAGLASLQTKAIKTRNNKHIRSTPKENTASGSSDDCEHTFFFWLETSTSTSCALASSAGLPEASEGEDPTAECWIGVLDGSLAWGNWSPPVSPARSRSC
jgi:hypothetical protein